MFHIPATVLKMLKVFFIKMTSVFLYDLIAGFRIRIVIVLLHNFCIFGFYFLQEKITAA